MRETLGRPPQSLGELLETGAVADRETSRRSSLAATSSGSFSIISPSKSPGSLPEDPSESPSPLVQPHSLPRSPTDAAVPPRCLPSAPTPLMAGQEMAQVPLLPQDYLMQHPTLRAPPPPPAGPCPQDGAPPASNFNQYANDYSQTHPGLWNQSMGALFQRFPDQRAGSRSDTPLQLQPFVTHQSQQIIQHPSHYQPAPTPQPPHPHPHQPQPIHPPHQHFLNTLDFYPSWPQQPGR